MMEFKPVPGYNPDDFRSYSNFGTRMRRWSPLTLCLFIFLTQFEWSPLWLTISTQVAIGIIAGLTLLGILISIFTLKLFSRKMNDKYKNPLFDSGNQIELSCIIFVCFMIYMVGWPITLAAYAGVNLLVVTMHVGLLIKQIRQKKG